MTKYTFDENTVSDLHKDAFGFRPSQAWFEQWNSNTDAEKQIEWDYLIKSAEASALEENEREQDAVMRFEMLVGATMDIGARTRENALRWIMQSSDADGNWEYFCFLNGLPYQYFKKVA